MTVLDPPPEFLASRLEMWDRLKAEKDAWLAAKTPQDVTITLPDGKVFSIPVKEQIEALGTMLDRAGSTKASQEHRRTKAEVNLGGIQRMLKSKNAGRRKKAEALSKGPMTSAIYHTLFNTPSLVCYANLRKN